MHHAGWTRLRLCPAVKNTPFLPQIRFLFTFRDNSFHRRTVPRIAQQYRGARNEKAPLRRSVEPLTRLPAPSSSKTTVPVRLTIDRSTSRKSLYENLLRLLESPATASLPILLDYHALHPAAFRSARSYNLLISMAIRHVAWGAVQTLVNNMASDGIPGNLETQVLKTRWLVRSGLWGKAWLQVTASHPKPIPLSLWLEFFHDVKVGALGNRLRPTSPPVNPPWTRFRILMQNLPVFLPNEDRKSVRTVHIIVRAMLALDRPQSAFTVAARYFHGLPRHISIKWAQKCVAIMDGLVAHETKRRGLLDFHAARRKLNSLLAIHPSFRPTSKTVYLLLGTLRQAKQCGTISWRTLTKYKTRWGPQVEDRRVRRRVASYAIIERRLDIFNKVFDAERRSRALAQQAEAKTKEQPSQLRRRPFGEIFSRRGYDDRLWKLLEARASKVRWLSKERQHRDI